MKKIFYVVALMSVVLAGCSKDTSKTYAKPDWFTNSNYFEEKNGMYEELPVYPTNIVMVGDDYIDRGLWSEFFGDTTLKNRGITYDGAEHVRYRIGKIAERSASLLIRGSHGNSGVITSLLFGGMAKFLKEKDREDFGVRKTQPAAIILGTCL